MAFLRAFHFAAVMTVAFAAAAQARTLEVGTGKEFKLPSAAIEAARAGDTVSIQPGEYFDCATVRASKLTIEGVGDPEKVVMTDKVCGGKGMLIVTGNDVTIRNLTLTRARVPDGNGAGIRNEAPNLNVDHVRFVNNQNGILSTPQEPGTIVVKDSLFERNGGCGNPGGCAHGAYFNGGRLLHIEHSVFRGTKSGHQIKSRTERTEIIGCTIEDGQEGTSSYLVDISVGGSLLMRDNTMEKGPEAENHSAAIVIGAEGVQQPTREIIIENNRFKNDGSYSTVFVNNLTATDAILRGNTLTGSVRPLNGDGKVTR